MSQTMREKLEKLQVLIVDKYIEELTNGDIAARDCAPIVTLLNHNKVVTKAEEEEGTHSKVKRLVRK